MASRVEYYKQRAAECLAKAAVAKDTTMRERFLALGRQWTALAERIENEEQERKSRK
jgi:hypothetical protein